MSPWPPVSGGGFGSGPSRPSVAPIGEAGADARPSMVIDEGLAEQLELGGLLGRGGMGEVRVAWDRALQREVAVKRMAGGASVARFLREAAITAQLAHPAIVPIYGIGRAPDGAPFYTMRLVRGQTLRARIDGGGGDPLGLSRRLLPVVEAVALAHRQGVVHRDIKPANILLGDFGETWLLDWGLAAAAGQVVGGGAGTVGYMAPEQAAGAPVDAAADVWSLGRVFGEVWAGQGVPPELQTILRRAVQGRAADRYPHADALAQDLRAWLEGRLVDAHPYTAPQLLGWAVGRWWPQLLALGGVGLVLLAVAGWGARQTSMERDRALQAQNQAVSERLRAEQILGGALVSQAREAETEGRWWDAERLARDALALGPSVDAVGVLAGVRARPRPQRLSQVSLPCVHPVFSPSGSHLACAEPGMLVLYQGDGHRLGEVPAQVGNMVVGGGEDPLVLYSGLRDRLFGWRPGGEPWPLGQSEVPHRRSLLWAGKDRIAAVGNSEHLLVHTQDGRATRVSCPTGSPSVAAHHPQGGWAMACTQGPVLLSADRGAHTWDFAGERVTAMTWDGDSLIVGVSDGRLHRWEAGRATDLGRPYGDAPTLLAARDGLLAVGSAQGNLEVWQSQGPGLVARFSLQPEDMVWSGPGRLRVATRTHLSEWDLAGSATLAPADPSGISGMAVSPDGRWAATAHGDGRVQLWSTHDDRTLRTLDLGPGVAKDVAFSRDGRWLAAVSAQTAGPVLLDLVSGAVGPALSELTHRRIEPLGQHGFVAMPYARELHWVDGRSGTPVLRAQALEFPFVESREQSQGGAVLGLDRQGLVRQLAEAGTGLALVQVLADHSATSVVAWAGEVCTGSERQIHCGVGERRLAATTNSDILDLAAHPEGHLLAVGLMDGTTEVFDQSGRVAVLRGHTARVSQVVFEDQGARLWTAGWDGRLRPWDVATIVAHGSGE